MGDMKKLFLITSLLFSSIVFSESLTLICEGESKTVGIDTSRSSTNIYGDINARSNTTKINPKSIRSDASLIIHFNDLKNCKKGKCSSGWIDLPKHMHPPIGTRKDKIPLLDVVISKMQMKARFKLNLLNKPRIEINRSTGNISVKGLGNTGFSGGCVVYEESERKF